MFKTIEIGEQPTMMNINAQAIWNEEKRSWEVNLVSTQAGTTLDGKYTVFQDTYSADVNICDEYVIATAIMDMFDIDVSEMNEEISPISNRKFNE